MADGNRREREGERLRNAGSLINRNEDVPVAKEAPLRRLFDHKVSADMTRARSCVCTAIWLPYSAILKVHQRSIGHRPMSGIARAFHKIRLHEMQILEARVH